MPYPEQLLGKRKELSRLLNLGAAPVIPSPKESGFRSKVAFVFANGVMGHYALKSQRVIPIEECPVHHERGNRIAFALRDRLARVSSISSLLRHIIIRTTDDGREASAMLVVRANDKALRAPVKKFLASEEKPDGFFVNIHTKPGPYMVGDETIKIEGRSHVKETVAGVSYLVSPTAFFQTNVGAAGELVKVVLEGLNEPKGSLPQGSRSLPQGSRSLPQGSHSLPQGLRVLDLYCGSGLFSLPLAKSGAQVTAIEENRQAIVDAEANVRLNRIDPNHVRFIAARVEDALARVERQPWDAVVLDPPRQGCAPAVLSAVFDRIRPSRAIYVSCNPDALAVELPVILKSGYRVTRAQPVDMFPHTDHIETVMTFERG